jgi:SAM-dependent methyltransferase
MEDEGGRDAAGSSFAGIHPHTRAFRESADAYEFGRPGYPVALLDFLGARIALDAGVRIVDLGAGTGKLTRVLVRSGALVLALEPVAEMRSLLAGLVPEAVPLGASAEAMPLVEASVDLVACGQSMRWFANDTALGEIARVLRRGGELAVVFNEDGEPTPFSSRFHEVLRLASSETAERKPGTDWREVVTAFGAFEPVAEIEIDNPLELGREHLVARLASSSQFSRLAVGRQQELIAELEEIAGGFPVVLPQVTWALALRRS